MTADERYKFKKILDVSIDGQRRKKRSKIPFMQEVSGHVKRLALLHYGSLRFQNWRGINKRIAVVFHVPRANFTHDNRLYCSIPRGKKISLSRRYYSSDVKGPAAGEFVTGRVYVLIRTTKSAPRLIRPRWIWITRRLRRCFDSYPSPKDKSRNRIV